MKYLDTLLKLASIAVSAVTVWEIVERSLSERKNRVASGKNDPRKGA